MTSERLSPPPRRLTAMSDEGVQAEPVTVWLIESLSGYPGDADEIWTNAAYATLDLAAATIRATRGATLPVEWTEDLNPRPTQCRLCEGLGINMGMTRTCSGCGGSGFLRPDKPNMTGVWPIMPGWPVANKETYVFHEVPLVSPARIP